MSYSICIACESMVGGYEKYCDKCIKRHPDLEQDAEFWKSLSQIFVLAQNSTEARELFDQGCGYLSYADAKDARNSPEIDSYYRSLMHIFGFRAKEGKR